MRYEVLGTTGIEVSRLCLGSMMFGRLGNRDHEDCLRIIHHALDAGINFIDTADVYSAGESEEIVGEALRGRRDDIIVATKSYFSVQDGPAVSRPRLNSSGSSRRHIVRACEDSLQRLGTDCIDLYQVHRIDYATDIDDTLGALSDLMQAGKIRAIGTSSFTAARIVEAQWTSERRNRERFACEQPQYSMFVREIEQEVLSTCQRFGMGVIVWSPLNAGWLSGARRRSSDSDGITTRRARLMPHLFDVDDAGSSYKFDLLEELARLAAQSDLPLRQLALAFVLEHPAVTSAIIGPRTLQHLEGLLGAEEVTLSTEVLDRIDELIPPGTNVSRTNDRRNEPWLSDAKQRRRNGDTGQPLP
jgi:aryl-alcohol dehydrogenase-like predicted oxidoreductase